MAIYDRARGRSRTVAASAESIVWLSLGADGASLIRPLTRAPATVPTATDNSSWQIAQPSAWFSTRASVWGGRRPSAKRRSSLPPGSQSAHDAGPSGPVLPFERDVGTVVANLHLHIAGGGRHRAACGPRADL